MRDLMGQFERVVEHLCTNAEMELAERLPNSRELVQMSVAKLERPWWDCV